MHRSSSASAAVSEPHVAREAIVDGFLSGPPPPLLRTREAIVDGFLSGPPPPLLRTREAIVDGFLSGPPPPPLLRTREAFPRRPGTIARRRGRSRCRESGIRILACVPR